VFVAVLVVAAAALIFAMQNWTSLAKARKLKNPIAPTADAIAAGMQVYKNHCQSCHGQYGDGKGEKASELSVAPGDFTDASKMNALTDGELYWQITKGRRPMPAFADKLSDEERWQSVDYIRTFARKPTGSAQP
jgi:mono/diheme cytochrome c family protein